MEKLSKLIFKYRSYTPIPFLLVMLYYQQATSLSLVIGFFISIIGEFFRLWVKEQYLGKTIGSNFEDFIKNVLRFFTKLKSYQNKNVFQPEFDIKKELKSGKDFLLAFSSVYNSNDSLFFRN